MNRRDLFRRALGLVGFGVFVKATPEAEVRGGFVDWSPLIHGMRSSGRMAIVAPHDAPYLSGDELKFRFIQEPMSWTDEEIALCERPTFHKPPIVK